MKVKVNAGSEHVFYHGDCLDILKTLPDKSIDIQICSPPFNIGKKYLSDNDDMPRSEYLDWCFKWLIESKRVLKDDGHFFLNIGSKPSSPQGPFQVFTRTVAAGWVLQNNFVWVKSFTEDAPEGPVSQGHFKPLNSERFVNDLFEPVFHLTKTGDSPINRYHLDFAVPHQDQSNVARWASGRKVRCRGNVLFVPYETIQTRGVHPAAYPIRLVEMLLGLTSVESVIPRATRTVLDVFGGSMSTAVACVRKGFNSIMIEKDETYFSAGVERVVEEAKKLQVPVDVSFSE